MAKLVTVWAREHNQFTLSSLGTQANNGLLDVPGTSETVGQPPGATILMGIFTFSVDGSDSDGFEIHGIVVPDSLSITATVPHPNDQETHWGAYHAGNAPQVIVVRSKRTITPNHQYRIRAVKRVGATSTVLSVYSQVLYLPK